MIACSFLQDLPTTDEPIRVENRESSLKYYLTFFFQIRIYKKVDMSETPFVSD